MCSCPHQAPQGRQQKEGLGRLGSDRGVAVLECGSQSSSGHRDLELLPRGALVGLHRLEVAHRGLHQYWLHHHGFCRGKGSQWRCSALGSLVRGPQVLAEAEGDNGCWPGPPVGSRAVVEAASG